MNDVVLLICS